MATEPTESEKLRQLLLETYIGFTTGKVKKEQAKTVAQLANEFNRLLKKGVSHGN